MLSNTNERENAENPTLSIEALRTIGRIVRSIKTTIASFGGQGSCEDTGAGATSVASGSSHPCPLGGEDHDRTNG